MNSEPTRLERGQALDEAKRVSVGCGGGHMLLVLLHLILLRLICFAALRQAAEHLLIVRDHSPAQWFS
jgi:hypothetical protein